MDIDSQCEVVESKSQLIDYFTQGCKPAEQFRLGAEQEIFVFTGPDLEPATYDESNPGIKSLLEAMQKRGWQPTYENGILVALSRESCLITLEPGGQFEFVGAPLENAHQTYLETRTHYSELCSVANEMGLRFLALGHQPKHTREQISIMPKQRYRVMSSYMPSRGNLGLDMMKRTCSVQVTADFSSEADLVKKFRVSLALQPIVVALFANSPFNEGRLTDLVSLRAGVWQDTDPDRCGSLPFVFEDGMGIERYMDYVLDVPMYFVIRDGKYIDASGKSFRDFLEGRLSILPGQKPLISDWVDHLSTVFPQVRLKQFLEFRGADAGDAVTRVPALVAFWAGLLYDNQSLDEALSRISDWKLHERLALESGVIRNGFKTPFRNETVKELAHWALDLSRAGLERRNIQNQDGQSESCYLESLQRVVESGKTFAELLGQSFTNRWQENMDIALPAMCEETFA